MSKGAALPGWRRLPVQAEDLALALALAAMMLLPLLVVPLRAIHVQIKGQGSIVQHLTLIAGMIGAAVAAREGRLLSLSSVDLLFKGTWRRVARSIAAAFAATVTALLCLASVQFVQSERAAGGTGAYDIPLWILQLALPIGFALIALRILRRSSDTWRGRAVTVALAGLLVLCVVRPPVPVASLTIPAFALLLLATVLGAPIFTVLGGAGLILFWRDGSPIASLTVDHYSLVTNPTLPTVPLFTLAGYFLAEAARRGA